MNFVESNNLSFKYQRSTPSSCKGIEIRKSEFVAKTQFFCYVYLCLPNPCSNSVSVSPLAPKYVRSSVWKIELGEIKIFSSIFSVSNFLKSALIKLTAKARSPAYTAAWTSSLTGLARKVSDKVEFSDPKQFLSKT